MIENKYILIASDEEISKTNELNDIEVAPTEYQLNDLYDSIWNMIEKVTNNEDNKVVKVTVQVNLVDED